MEKNQLILGRPADGIFAFPVQLRHLGSNLCQQADGVYYFYEPESESNRIYIKQDARPLSIQLRDWGYIDEAKRIGYSTTYNISSNPLVSVGTRCDSNQPNSENSEYAPDVVLNIPRSEAPLTVPDIQALIVFKSGGLESLKTSNSHIEKSDSDHYDWNYFKYTLSGEVLGIIIYSTSSGKILARLPNEFGVPTLKAHSGK